MTQPVALPTPTQDEKTMALLAEILQIFTWWIGPLVIYLLKRESKFISFHAMQALLWQCTLMILWMVGVGIWIVGMFVGMVAYMRTAPPGNSPPPAAFFLSFGLFWFTYAGLGVVNVIVGIVYCVRASRGEWAQYPLLGRLARRIVEV